MADLNIEQLMNDSEVMRMLKMGNPERSKDFDIPKLDVGLFDIERQLKRPLENALYNSPDPNGTIAKFDTALMLNNLGIDMDTAHKMADMGYMSSVTGVNTKDKNYFEALTTTAKHAWWEEMKGVSTAIYRNTGNYDFLKYADEYQGKIEKNPILNEYGGFGDLVLSGVQPTMSTVKFIATTALLSWIPGGIGIKTGSKFLQGIAKAGNVASKGINLASAGYSQAGSVLYDVTNTEDAEGNTLPWESPINGVLFNVFAGIMGTVELGSMEAFPWYRALTNKFTNNQLMKHIQRGMVPAVKNFLWLGAKGWGAESGEEFTGSLLTSGFVNALRAQANADGAEFEIDSFGDSIKEASMQFVEAGKSMFLTTFLTAGFGQGVYSAKMRIESKKNFTRSKTSISIDPFFVNSPGTTKNQEESKNQEETPTETPKKNTDPLEPIKVVRVEGRLIPVDTAELEKAKIARERDAKVLEVEVTEETPVSAESQTALAHQAALATEGKILNENTVVYESKDQLDFATFMLSPNIEAVTKTDDGVTLSLRNEEGTISTLNLSLTQEDMELSDPDLAYVEDEEAPYALSRMKEERALEWQERKLIKEKIGDVVGHTGGKISTADLEANVDAFKVVADTLGLTVDEMLDKNIVINLANEVVVPSEKEGEQAKKGRGSVEYDIVDGQKRYTITLSKKADVSTVLHELGHTLRGLATPEQLSEFKKHYGSEELEGAFLDDITKKGEKFAVAGKEFNTYKEAAEYVNVFEERFANDFVAYLRTGMAPTTELKNVFSRMKAVLIRLIDEFGYRLTPEVQQAFDNLISGKTQSSFSEQVPKVLDGVKDFSDAEGNVLFQGESYSQVRDQYINSKDWMKAPNGKKTNLSEEQWIAVRTPAFIRWFGDWINDPENASKLIDKNGEPMVFYHGTEQKGLVEFDKEYIGSGTDSGFFSSGFYFASDKKNAEGYGENLLQVFLKMVNPFDYQHLFNWKNGEISHTSTNLAYWYNLGMLDKEFQWDDVAETDISWNDFVNRIDELSKTLSDPFAEFMKENDIDPEYFDEMDAFEFGPDSHFLTDVLERNGYDGVIGYGKNDNTPGFSVTDEEFVIFEPNQIKSATSNNVSFSNDNPNILFQEAPKDYKPKSTGIGYKVFFRKNGKLYPPMVANPGGEGTPVGKWLIADSAPVAKQTKTGRPLVKAGGKGTRGSSGYLAYRPGWHLGEIPYATQFNRFNELTGEKDLFPKDFVWAEVEYNNETDYKDEAKENGITKNGKFRHAYASLDKMPTDGFYNYRTNPDPTTDPWIITGAIKVNKILSRAEVDEIVKKAGRESQKVEGDSTLYQLDAWHGSPHIFDKFSMSRVNWGEGSQEQGWGLYFTGKEEIAKWYASQLNNYEPDVKITMNGNVLKDYKKIKNNLESVEDVIAQAITEVVYEKERARYNIEEEGKTDSEFNEEVIEEAVTYLRYSSDENSVVAAEFLSTIKPNDLEIEVEKYRSLYKATLHKGKDPSKYRYLDYYKETPKDIINKVLKIIEERYAPEINWLFSEYNDFEEFSSVMRNDIEDEYVIWNNVTQDDFYDKIKELIGDKTGVKTSKLFLEAGVDGHKYPSEDEGEFNYVVFDDSAVTIEAQTLFQKAPVIATQAFKKWFKDSKVVDSEGNPLVVYHGTDTNFTTFEQGDIGFHFGTKKAALSRAGKGTNVLPVYLSIKNPLIIDHDIYQWDGSPNSNGNGMDLFELLEKMGIDTNNAVLTEEEVDSSEEAFDSGNMYHGLLKTRRAVQNAGYDGIIYKNEHEDKGSISYIALENTQVKSVNNQGTWDSNNTNILYQESIDKRYFDALEKEDIETVQKIVDDQARKKGYISNNDFRMNHQAPNGHDDFSVNLARINETDLIPDGFWEHPNWYTGNEERHSFSQVEDALARYKKNGKANIRLYRAIPKNVKEDMFRNGDWVTPDREYAKNEGAMIPEGYRIVVHTVPLEHVWWDVNSIAELGYDDGKEYAYRDTLNNRKLTDALVYDVDGKIVPPSKRFNYRSYTLFQKALPIDSAAFKKWFGDSKVVDEKGSPRVIYHGTDAQFDTFNKDTKSKTGHPSAKLGYFFTSSREVAGGFSRDNSNTAFSFAKTPDNVIMEVYASIQNPKILSRMEFTNELSVSKTSTEEYGFMRTPKGWNDYKQELISQGYDGVIIERDNKYSVAEEFKDDTIVAFEPTQIKSINNQGTWDSNNPNILFQKAPPAGPQFKKWFDGSKAVDENGEPLVVYHGTSEAFTDFIKELMGSNTGAMSAKFGIFFTATKDVAQTYADTVLSKEMAANRKETSAVIKELQEKGIDYLSNNADFDNPLVARSIDLMDEYNDLEWKWETDMTSAIIEANLVMKNPLILDEKGGSWEGRDYASILEKAKSDGHDGVIFKNARDSMNNTDIVSDQYVVFDDSQIGVTQYYDIEDDYEEAIPFERSNKLFQKERPSTFKSPTVDIIVSEALANNPLFLDPKKRDKKIEATALERVVEQMLNHIDTIYERNMKLAIEAETWYHDDIKKFREMLVNEVPEASDDSVMALFAALIGINSNGADPRLNASWATSLLKYFLRTGTFPEIINEKGKYASVAVQTSGDVGLVGGVRFNTQYQKLQQLLRIIKKTGSIESASKWLLEEHTGQELLDITEANSLSGIAKTGVYNGFDFIGPKTGQFAMALLGYDNLVVKDKWFTRTWNRILGTPWQSYKKTTKDVLAGAMEKEEKERSSYEASFLVEAPRNKYERELMDLAVRNVAKKVSESLGRDVSPSAIQAMLWYNEQDLHRSYGVPIETSNFSGAMYERQRTLVSRGYLEEDGGGRLLRRGIQKENEKGSEEAPQRDGSKEFYEERELAEAVTYTGGADSYKSQIKNPTLLYQLSPKAKQQLLDYRKNEVKIAVENFFYVPQDILEEYAGEEWADDEINFRAHLKKNPWLLEEAHNYSNTDEYLDFIKSYVETGDYEWGIKDKLWFLRIHAYSRIQDPKEKDAQFVRLNIGTDKALISLGKDLRGYEDVDVKGNTNRRNYDGRFVRYHWGSFKGVSTKVKRLTKDSTAEELQEARDLIKANPRPYRKAVQVIDAARERVQDMKGFIPSGDAGRDSYYDALGEEMEEALNEPLLLNGMTNRQAAEYLRTSTDKKERYNAREKLSTHDGVIAMEQQANAELKKLGVEKDASLEKSKKTLKRIMVALNETTDSLKKEKRALKTAQSDLNKEQARIEKLQGKLKEKSKKASMVNQLEKDLADRRARVKELRSQLTVKTDEAKKLKRRVEVLDSRIKARKLKEALGKLHKRILATVTFNSDSVDASFEEAFNLIHSLFEQDQRPGGWQPLPQQISQYIADEQLQWVQQGRKINRWTLGELEILYEAAQLMRSDAKVMLEQKKVQRMNKLQNISAQMYKQQYGLMPEMGVGYGSIMNDLIDDLTINRDTYDENIFDAIVQTVRSSIGKMQRISRMLDGNKEGVAYQLLVRNAYENMTEELRESYRRLTEADKKMSELKITSDLLAKDSFEYTTSSGQKKTLSKSEVIGLYVYSQNPLGMQKLIHNRGNNISLFDLNAAIRTLSENEKDWGDYMLENLGSDAVWERMNKTYVEVYNRNLGRRKKYFTFVADGKVDEGKTDLLVGPQGAKVRYVDKDFTKVVNPHAIYPLKLNVTHTFTSQVKKQEHFVQWADWVRDMNYLLTKGAVGRIIEMNYGPKFMNTVQEYVSDVGSPQVILDDIERMGSKIISNAAVAALSLNFLTMLKQLPSFSSALRGDIGVVELTNVAMRLMNPKTHAEAVKFIHEMSPYMLKRSISIEVEKYNASDFDSFVGRKIQKFNENIGMKGIQMMDQAAVNTLWLAAYDTYIRRNPNNLSGEALKKEAAFRSTQLISETQPTSIANDLSSLQRKKSPFVRSALLFTNQLFQYVNMAWYDLPTSAKAYIATKDLQHLRKAFGIILNMAISGGMIMLVSGVAFRKDDEDDDDYWKRIRHEIMKMTASYSLPVIGGDVGQGISGWSYGGGLVDLPSSFGRMLGADWTDLDNVSDRAWDLLDGAGSIGGLPTAFINRVIKSVKNSNPFEMFGSSYGDLWEKWHE